MSSSAILNLSIPKTQEKTEITSEPAGVSRPVESPEQSDQDLARVAEIYSANIEQSLGVINTLEEMLQAKRSRMEELRTDHEELALKYKLLGKSLASANRDLAQQFASVIGNLRSDLGLDAVSNHVSEAASDDLSDAEIDIASDAESETPAEDIASTTVVNLNLGSEKQDMPSLPKFLSNTCDASEVQDRKEPSRAESPSRGWWKHGKKS